MTHQFRGGGSTGLSNNNYYAFTTSNPNANGIDPDATPTSEQELAGGGLSFVIHSPASSSSTTLNKNQQQHGSISSVASSASSGISSGSSTITKSSGFNGNTFTRSKPKERKPLPNGWQQEQEQQEKDNDHHHHLHQYKHHQKDQIRKGQNEEGMAAALSSAGAGDTPLKGKGLFPVLIPSVTLSEATSASPSPSRPKSKNTSSIPSESFYFNLSDNSSSGSVVQPLQHKRKADTSYFSDTSNADHNTSINFEPGACSTFILAEGEEFPEESGGGSGININKTRGASSSSRRNNNDIGRNKINISSSNNSSGNSIGADKYEINNIGDDITIAKMKADKSVTEQQLSSSASGVVTNGSSSVAGAVGGVGSESPNGSSSGIHSNFSGEEENFECFGEGGESFTFQESCGGSGDTSLQYSRDGTDLDLNNSSLLGTSGTSTLSRNSWTRTSLRKSPSQQPNGEAMGYRRWGSFRNAPGTKRTSPAVTSSNALANQLYRSSSFHSSGRSSAGDAEEMYSDGSLEDEVIDLTHKVHHLEEKMNVLAENQNDADDRYTREKEKNAELSTKVFMLEEQLRETELRGDEKLREEQRRFKEFQSRWEREKQLQTENYEIRVQSMEKDLSLAKTDALRLKNQTERDRSEKELLRDKLSELERELSYVRDENRSLTEQGRKDREQMAVESAGAQHALMELKKEVEGMRQFQIQHSPSSLRSRHEESAIEEELMESHELRSRIKEYEEEIKKLRKVNQQLQESNDELNAQLLNRGLEEGMTLLTTINSVPAGNSLAAEFEAMSQDQSALGLYADSETDLAKVKKALKEQVEVNEQLRSYIDGILLIIVENNPQLLEVKNNVKACSNNGINKSEPCESQSITSPNNNKCQPPASSPSQGQTSTSSKISFANGLSKISFRK